MVNSVQETFDDTELVVDDLCERSKMVGRECIGGTLDI